MRNLFWLALCVCSISLVAPRVQADAGELPRAGAPRPLRLTAPDGAPLLGVPGDVAWETRGGGVFFTLERGGTRNIWRAFPDPQDASRFPAWRALPVTDLRAPRYAAQPAPLPGDRALICVSNVLASASQNVARVAQIVRFDLTGAHWTALSDGGRFYQSPNISPDGTRVAFAGSHGDQMRVFTAPKSETDNRLLPVATPIMDKARHPIWLDNNSLLVESVAPGASGLYRIALHQPTPKIVIGGGGEANVAGDDGIVFSAKTAPDVPTQLYLIARDGSGLRVLGATENARRPATSPDGKTLAFDAPLNGARALWLLPLLRAQSSAVASNTAGLQLIAEDNVTPYEAPTAQLTQTRAASEGIAIIGNLRGGANSVVKLEVGQGEKPRRWEKIDVKFPPTAPLIDLQGNRVLTFWNPPKNARGVWTLRLSLSSLGGGAQSLLRVRLPLPLDVLPPIPTARDNATPRADSGVAALPRATPLPSPDSLPVPDDKNADANDDVPAFPTIQSPDLPPIPPIVAPPNMNLPTPETAPVQVPPTPQIPIVPIAPMPAPTKTLPQIPIAPAPAKTPPSQMSITPMPVPVPTSVKAPTDTPEVVTNEALAKAPTNTPDIVPVDGASADENVSDDSDYGDVPAATGAPFIAQFNVSGTPARMEPGQKIKVTFWGLNRGTANWQTGSDGANRVRLVARWVDFSTGTRRGWNFFWLRDAVAPGERTKWDFDLTAPARPGKYKLIYGLVQLPASGEFKAPAYSAPQESWDGEFGAIAFAVEVAPKTE